METSTGHVLPGLCFCLVGLWHMSNQIKLHATHPKSHFSLLWFPCPKIRYLELYMIILGSFAFISTEVLVGLQSHTSLDRDGSIPFSKLRKFEHANVATALIAHAVFSVVLDKTDPPAKHGMAQLFGVMVFGQELLSFSMHSTDHMGVEGQYHFFLQIIILVSLSTTLLGFPFPTSFMNGFVRSCSVMFQGIWLLVIGIMLWTPGFSPKGCFFTEEHEHHVVKCRSEEAAMRAKSLVNILFSLSVISFTILVVTIYLVLFKCYSENIAYESLPSNKFEDNEKEDLIHDVESQKGFVEMGKLIVCHGTVDMK
ncbi:PREDICTED: uncharacterized protein LOC109159691 [Ipomoea nil]|uniref:uncharacterized protein LOC109159691 n=1 Tax=Ipomoea nil TaxID=35883 RepID=UPI000900BEEA|nr:PREDICTED: uncharacterized protein LOC109159691 [Ipomoea nil]